ncbi:hypothetical protein D3C79_729930 [compost metagenome]
MIVRVSDTYCVLDVECCVVAGSAIGQLLHVGFTNDDCTGILQWSDNWCILRRKISLQGRSACSIWEADHLDVVLDSDRDAPKWKAGFTIFYSLIVSVRLQPGCFNVNRDEGIEILMVIDAGEVGIQKFTTGNLLCADLLGRLRGGKQSRVSEWSSDCGG